MRFLSNDTFGVPPIANFPEFQEPVPIRESRPETDAGEARSLVLTSRKEGGDADRKIRRKTERVLLEDEQTQKTGRSGKR